MSTEIPLDKLQRMVRQLGAAAVLAAIPEAQREQVLYAWVVWAREGQQLPPGAWRIWLILAGRGWGKTRCGVEAVREWVKTNTWVNFIGATADDAREIMIEGESGILAKTHRSERPVYVKHERKLRWPNGAISQIFTADEPDRLRGKQHMKLWADELAAWKYPEAWDQAVMGLRLGTNPQAVVTTTPRPTPIIKALIADPLTKLKRGRTLDNAKNLAPGWLSDLLKKYQGTRLGQQELEAEVLSDSPGALWKMAWIDDARVVAAPPLDRIVVAVDPATTSGPDSDDTGIVVAGIDALGQGYTLADLSLKATPDGWARVVSDAFHVFKANRVIAESNQGGEMVGSTLQHVDAGLPVDLVHAKQAKQVRADPIAALYEQGRAHHVGIHADLEDELTTWEPKPGSESPNRLDALVYAFQHLFEPQRTRREDVNHPRRQEDEMERKVIERLRAEADQDRRWRVPT